MEEQHSLNRENELSDLIDLGSSLIRAGGGTVYVLTIVGQVEGHQLLPPDSKSTKYEHILPLLAMIMPRTWRK